MTIEAPESNEDIEQLKQRYLALLDEVKIMIRETNESNSNDVDRANLLKAKVDEMVILNDKIRGVKIIVE